MSSDLHAGLGVLGERKRAVAAVVPVVDADLDLVPAVLEDLRRQTGVNLEIILVDATLRGDLIADGVRIIREHSPSRGLAFRRALTATSAEWIALCSPNASSAPDRIARQLEAVQYEDDIDAVTCDLHVERPVDRSGERYTYRVSMNLGTLPPGCWEHGILIHRDVLGEIGTECFAPAELELLLELTESRRVIHVAEPLIRVGEQYFEACSQRTRVDADLLQLARNPRRGEPEVTVLLATHQRCDVLLQCLEAYARQLVVPGTIEIVVVDDGSTDGTKEVGEALELAVPLTFIHQEPGGASRARIVALAHARGRLILFVNDNTIPFPDNIQRHIEAHQELEGRQAMVIGTFEQPEEHLENALARLIDTPHYVFDDTRWKPGQELTGMAFHTCHLSAPRHIIEEVGGFDPEFSDHACEDIDLGVRLEQAGWTIHYRPECRAIHQHFVDFETLRRRQGVVALAYTRFFQKHPHLLSGNAWSDLTRYQLEQHGELIEPFMPVIEAATRTLAGVNLAKLERAGGSVQETAGKLYDRLGDLFRRVNNVWWNQGFLEGFELHGLTSFTDVFAEWSPALPPVEGHAVLLRPAPAPTYIEAAIGWTTKVEQWLSRFGSEEGQGPDGAFLVILADSEAGVSEKEIQSKLAPILTRARRSGHSTPIAIVDTNDAQVERRLFEEARTWIPSGSERDDADAVIARETACECLELIGDANSTDPHWPLSTNAPLRVLAWPNWATPDSFGGLVETVGALLGRNDLCLVLRHDPDQDADPEPGLAALQSAFDVSDTPLEVLIESAPMDAVAWDRMARSIDAVLAQSPSSSLAALRRPILKNSRDVRRWLAALDAAPTFTIPVLPRHELFHA